ncbi:hypothetical protein QTJ16_003856 [Diplocarpon rosae]|uniref:Homeobox domain-containing protein n=1 Tax=Diplocarpon rosae TaxID=946125 RepID=A0AAD9SZX4_9HELO|nr:hypothetical protein QTJ16_003856 [Diplocarpon rosae]
MELSQPRYISRTQWESPPSREGSNMAALTLRQPPAHHLPGPTALLDSKLTDLPFIPRSENRSRSDSTQFHSSPMQLPPIREIVDFSARPEPERRREVSPTSNGKRRRPLDDEDDEEARARYSPRQRSPGPPVDRSQSTSSFDLARRSSVAYSTSDNWSARSSPYQPSQGLPPLQTSNLPSRPDMRSQAPTLPPLSTLASPMSFPAANFSEYSLGGPRPSVYTYPTLPRSNFDAPPPQSTFSYGYQQPRGQSYSGPSSFAMSHDRSPFSSAPNAYSGSMNPYGAEGHERESDSRQRKRRGNLPKETTDKLRAWFMTHLTHPYPTEDEKQELMRQTGLQMNQISNWFINARRRQLPTMINNARAESDARIARGGDICAPAPSNDYGEESDRRSEGSQYDDEFDARQRGILAGPKARDSI